MEKPVRLAIAGFGLVGRRHAKAIGQSSSAELVAVIEPAEDARRAARDEGFLCHDNLRPFLSEGGADGIILATPNRLHAEQGLLCVEHGLPVLVEKPIAASSDEALRLVEAAGLRGVPLLVGHHRRHNPLIQRAKELIGDGKLGQIRSVQATCWLYKPDSYFEAAEWRQRPGAGPVSVNLVHDIDLLRYLCGEIRSVHAAQCRSLRGYENEDVAGSLITFENGAVGTLSVSDSIVAPWSWELTSRENPAYPPTAENCYQIGGSLGSLSIPDLRLWTYADGGRDWWAPISATVSSRDFTDPLVNQIENFAAVLRGRARPLVSGEEGLRSLKVVEAIRKSAGLGQTIALD